MPQNQATPNGPIPGENFTSDTKNYPWHRPPEIDELDKGIEAAIKQLGTRKGAFGLLNSLQAGVTVVQATDMFITSGIGAGKWAPDLGLLLAGPVARMMEIMAKDAGITYALGLEEDPVPTMKYYKQKAKITEADADSAATAVQGSAEQLKSTEPESTPEPQGFMSKPPEGGMV